MSEWMQTGLENGAALFSIAAMGVFGVGLLRRLLDLVRGQESADGLQTHASEAPGRDLMIAALAAMLSRIMIYAIAYGMYRIAGNGGGFFQSLQFLWGRWDTRHYIGIAQDGYVNVGDERLRLVFFPLFPMMMRLFSVFTGGDVFMGGLLVSLLCTSGSAALLYALSWPHGGRGFAWRCVAYCLLSPLSVFLCCCYTEALFLCLTLGAMVLLRRGHPWLAALCGAASAFTRMPGVIVAGLFLIRLLADIPKGGFRPRAVAACMGQMLVVFGGLFLYWAVNWAVTGAPLTYLVYQRENWFQAPGFFWESMKNTVSYCLTTVGDSDWLFSWFAQLVCMLGIFALLALRGNRLPFELAAYSFVYVVVVLSPTWLLSGPRYLFALAPLPLLKAEISGRRGVHTALLAISAALLVLWIYGFAIAGDVL